LKLEFNKTVYILPDGEIDPLQSLEDAQRVKEILATPKAAEGESIAGNNLLQGDDGYDGEDDADIDILFKQHFLTSYPFYENAKAYMRPYTQGLWDASEYSDWTETRQFSEENLQDVVGTEYSDNPWTMTDQVKKSFSADVDRFVLEDEPENGLLLGIHYDFKRYLPLDA